MLVGSTILPGAKGGLGKGGFRANFFMYFGVTYLYSLHSRAHLRSIFRMRTLHSFFVSLLSVFWEWWSPNLAACGLLRGSTSGPVRPVFINQHPRPSRGAKPRGADDARPPQGRPHQAGSRGGGEIKGKGTSRGAHDASHDDRDQAGARWALACVVSSFPLWCKGGKHRRGVPRHQAKVSQSV